MKKSMKPLRRVRSISLTQRSLAAIVAGTNGTIIVQNLVDLNGPTSDASGSGSKLNGLSSGS
jgi:hypothetical protein